MGLSAEVVEAHIDSWEDRLSKGNRPYRRNWPSRLFRHEPLENAIDVLQSGQLLSRRDAQGQIKCDIAPEEIINATDAAHAFARLYFRPKTPTQYRIEGIRKPDEVYQGRHATVLVMMVFDARGILTDSATRFSDGNMQSPITYVGSTDAEFEALHFDHIFHEGAYDTSSLVGDDIRRRRCAEVLLASPHPLENSLQAILCRSSAERATLLHLLGEQSARRWSDKVRVYTQPGIFQNEWAYMSELNGGPEGVSFTIHPRRIRASVRFSLRVTDDNGNVVFVTGPEELDPAARWRVERDLPPGRYVAQCKIEGCLAYKAPFVVDELPF